MGSLNSLLLAKPITIKGKTAQVANTTKIRHSSPCEWQYHTTRFIKMTYILQLTVFEHQSITTAWQDENLREHFKTPPIVTYTYVRTTICRCTSVDFRQVPCNGYTCTSAQITIERSESIRMHCNEALKNSKLVFLYLQENKANVRLKTWINWDGETHLNWSGWVCYARLRERLYSEVF